MSDDPLSITYSYLWSLVEAYPPWADMVRTGNRLHLDGNSRNPFKETLKAADLPQVTLLPTDANNNLHSNSSSAVIVQNFTIGLYAGDLRVNESFFPLKFYTLQALACFRLNLGDVTWKDYPFLKKVEVPQSTDTITEFDATGNIMGWDSLLTISCEMWFPNTLFLEQ